LEDQVGVHHVRHRVGRREELYTTLAHPHQFRKTPIGVYRLKNMRWSLLRKEQDGRMAHMPELMQISEEEADYGLQIEDQKRKCPSVPGTSTRERIFQLDPATGERFP
jgi:hypothetical protein